MMMKQISNKNIKAFAKRFGYQRKGKSGIVPLTVEQARDAINSFISLNGALGLKPSFVETRVKLIDICLKEKTAITRWKKVKDYLLDRLESQVLGIFITQGEMEDKEVDPPDILKNLMDPNSYLCQCIKTVVLFNITDVNEILPDDVLIDFGSGIEYSFPEHTIKHQVIILKAITINGVIIERGIPANDDNLSNIFGDVLNSKFATKYSFLSDQNSNIHVIQEDKLFNSIREGYPEFIRTYKSNSDMKPSLFIENAFTREVQQKIIGEFIGRNISDWKWDLENKKVIDISKIVDEFFPDIEDRIISIRPNYPVTWEPENYLFDENSLRYELADQFLKRFESFERESLMSEYIKDISVFNLKTFRDLLQKLHSGKEHKKITSILSKLNSNYYESTNVAKERHKIIEYVKITAFIQQGLKRMLAYRHASPLEKDNTVEQRYLRQKKQLEKSGYQVDNPDHLSVLMKDWNISEFELNFIN